MALLSRSYHPSGILPGEMLTFQALLSSQTSGYVFRSGIAPLQCAAAPQDDDQTAVLDGPVDQRVAIGSRLQPETVRSKLARMIGKKLDATDMCRNAIQACVSDQRAYPLMPPFMA